MDMDNVCKQLEVGMLTYTVICLNFCNFREAKERTELVYVSILYYHCI